VGDYDLCAEAAAALAASDTRIAELEEARAEQWRMRREAEGSRDACKAACDTMRIERDEARDRLATTRSALDEARGALKETKATLTDLDARLIECGALHTAEDAYDTSYRGMVIDALVSIDSALSTRTAGGEDA